MVYSSYSLTVERFSVKIEWEPGQCQLSHSSRNLAHNPTNSIMFRRTGLEAFDRLIRVIGAHSSSEEAPFGDNLYHGTLQWTDDDMIKITSCLESGANEVITLIPAEHAPELVMILMWARRSIAPMQQVSPA